MAATPHPSDPDPSEPQPLSEHEERALSDLEARTAADDPTLDARLARRTSAGFDRLSVREYNALIQVGVVFVVAVAVLPRPWAVGLIVAGVMLVPAVIAHFVSRGDR
jgi:Flp pilus assembly protein TadB